MADKILITNENYMDLDKKGRPIYTINDPRLYKNRLREIYTHMKERCYNKNRANYHTYGARGVRVCDEWKDSFTNFAKWALRSGFYYQDPSTPYKDLLSIDRIDSSKGYSPSNCRWLSVSENSRRADRSESLPKAIAASVEVRIKSYKCVETGIIVTNSEKYCKEHGWPRSAISTAANPNNHTHHCTPDGRHWQKIEENGSL